ncbi:MAG: YceD family protein [Candidatus Eiseniibacteriota bacterium]
MTEHPEFSRIVDRAALATLPIDRTIEAGEAEREALGRRFGLLELPALAAEVTLSAAAGGQVRLDGRLRARVVQACVVTLEPVAAEIDESFTLFYAEAAAPAGQSVDLPIDDEAWPEPMVDGAIDIGEAVAQQLAVALDPYPRAPGATLDGRYGAAEEAAPARANPFADLARKRGSKPLH